STFQQLFFDTIHADFIKLIDRHRHRHQQLGFIQYLGDARKNFPVVEFDSEILQSQEGESFVVDEYKFCLIEETFRTDNVDVALVEFAVTTALWPVGTPDRLNLKALKRQRDLMLVHDNVAGERHGKIIT